MLLGSEVGSGEGHNLPPEVRETFPGIDNQSNFIYRISINYGIFLSFASSYLF